MSRLACRLGALIVPLAAVLAAGTLTAAPPQAGRAAAPSPVRWQTDLKAAHELSVATGKPLLIVFGAEWCGFCHKLEDKTLGDPRMAAYVNEAFIPVHVDFDKQPRVAQILEVEAIPCTIVLSPEADLLGRLDGYMDVTKFRAGLDGAREAYGKIQQVKFAKP